jgi:hypothetical protein
MTIRWWQRFQVEVGGRWQMMPSRDMSPKEWLWSPFAGYVYPGKIIKGRQDLPEGEIYGGLEGNGTDAEPWRSLVWWVRFGIRICGLDVGMGVFVRSQKSVDKLTKKV